MALPRVLGHEFVGVVVAAGADATTAVGTRVTADTDGGCGRCRWCLRGLAHACADQRRIGTQRDGGFAEYVAVPERSIRVVPAALDYRLACMLEPFACAVRAVGHLPNLVGTTGAVIGPGPIGLLAATALHDAGCNPVLVVGLPEDEHRLRAAEKLGFRTATVDEAPQRASEVEPLGGFDAVVDAVGSAGSLMLAARLTRFGGHVSIVGVGPAGTVDVRALLEKELTVHGSWRRLLKDWDTATAIALRRPDLVDLVDGLYGLEDARSALDALVERRHVKAIVQVNV
jgi:L-iditol 2-dehydrogenase